MKWEEFPWFFFQNTFDFDYKLCTMSWAQQKHKTKLNMLHYPATNPESLHRSQSSHQLWNSAHRTKEYPRISKLMCAKRLILFCLLFMSKWYLSGHVLHQLLNFLHQTLLSFLCHQLVQSGMQLLQITCNEGANHRTAPGTQQRQWELISPSFTGIWSRLKPTGIAVHPAHTHKQKLIIQITTHFIVVIQRLSPPIGSGDKGNWFSNPASRNNSVL